MAVVRSDGEALVLHVGERPYVVAASGPVELSRQGLGLGAMEGMLAQLLNADALRTLREMGAVEHELEQRQASAGDRFTVVAARGGDDIWIELRRHRRLAEPTPVADVAPPAPTPFEDDAAPAIAKTSPSVPDIAVAPPSPPEPDVAVTMPSDVELEDQPIVLGVAGRHADTEVDTNSMPTAAASSAPPLETPDVPLASLAEQDHLPIATASDWPIASPASSLPSELESVHDGGSRAMADEELQQPADEDLDSDPFFSPQPVLLAPSPSDSAFAVALDPAVDSDRPPVESAMPMRAERAVEPVAPPIAARTAAPAPSPAPFAIVPHPRPLDTAPAPAASSSGAGARERVHDETLTGVASALDREGFRNNGSTTRGPGRLGGIERLLRVAAARGASALYLTTQARPAVRVDGDIRLLDGEPALSSGDVEAAVLELAPEGARDKESAEWIRDLDDVGRVRITTFRDYRGPGAILRMIQARATTAEQLGLVREIQALASEPEGLVIVTGPRASGKSTLVSAFVDLINRQRNDHVITLEGQIRFVHESRGSLVSQREVRGSAAEVVAEARAALRENPDVLVIEDLRSPDVLQAALDAAGSGLLVFASVTAASATAALERLVDLCPSDQRRTVRAALAEHLRGVVAQVLLRKSGGGRLAARELVLNTSAVAALIGDGQIVQLPRAIDSGRKVGMAPLNDALVAFVQSGAVDVREAYRKADDKTGFLALLRREGIDTSFVERLA